MIRRVHAFISSAFSIWLAVTVAFFALRILPGDALQAQLSMSGASQAVIETRRAALGLDAPPLIQYIRYLQQLIQGDLGVSLVSGEYVADALLRNLPPTITLALSAGAAAGVLGIVLGFVSASGYGRLSTAARAFTALSLSVPIYWSGIAAIFLFSVQLSWLPASGAGSPAHLVLPFSLLAFHTAGSIARVAQASISTAAQADFARTARAKGLREAQIAAHHVLRVGLLPVVSATALQFGFLLSGAVVTESMFVRPGIGRLLLDAVIKQDYPVIQGVVLISALAYALVTAAANALNAHLDPRIRV